MPRHTFTRFSAPTILAVVFCGWLCPAAFAAPAAQIEILAVSPRQAAASTTDVFDSTASGLRGVGIGQKTYLQAVPAAGAGIGGYQWAITTRPTGSTAALNSTTNQTIFLRPDKAGDYTITLTPLDASMQPTTPTTQLIMAGKWVGSGLINTHETPDPTIPQCGTTWCHGGENADPRLSIGPEWILSKHANKLQSHMNGEQGTHYATSCLPCHTLGFDTSTEADNSGFDDAARLLNYDLAQIPALVEDAATNHKQNFNLLPAELQNMSSIQCESCHGMGYRHVLRLTLEDRGIDGANLDPRACRQCHDSATGYQQKFYEWDSSTHPQANMIEDGHVAESASCVKCHTGEGFVDVQVNGLPATVKEHTNGITCSACHDPHYSNKPSQLRVTGDFKLDSGQTYTNAGLGGTCMRCHNGRVSNAESQSQSSSRRPHEACQTDMLLGVNGLGFGLPFEGNSYHTGNVKDTCVKCHMATPPGTGATPPKAGSHSFSMRDDNGTPEDPSDDVLNAVNACGECHGPIASYDVPALGDYDGDGVIEGTQTEVRGLIDILRNGIIAKFAGTSISESGAISIGNSDFANLTADQKRAFYNVNFVIKDGSLGVHNTSFAVQLLQRSYGAVFGKTIDEDYPKMELRGPVKVTDPVPPVLPGAIAGISVLKVSPRDAAASTTDIFNEVATGLNVAGIGQQTFLQAKANEGATVSGYQWSLVPQAGSKATLNVQTDGSNIAILRPDLAGKYSVILTPLDGSGQPTTKTVQTVYASRFIGAGLLNVPPKDSTLPQCSTGFCHGGNNAVERLNVAPEWVKSKHATKLQRHLNGELGNSFPVTCIPCHSTGYDADPLAVNGGFDDVAKSLPYDLNLIPGLVKDAADNHHQNFGQLPAPLQEKASIQCESCHGPGSQHPVYLSDPDHRIAGASFDPGACAQCHDSGSHHIKYDYWKDTPHALVESHMSENTGCVKCHTGEGFVDVQVKGKPAVVHQNANGITCVACHDPHYSENDAQLRLEGDVTLDSGDVIPTETAGLGGLCMRCHNARVKNAELTAATSSRGAHHGTQADVYMGVNGVSFGLPFEESSFHSVGVFYFPGVPDSCVFCHMGTPGKTGKIGDHTFSMRDEATGGINAENTCGQCHKGLTTYNRTAWADYDGDGKVEGIQTEMHGLFDILRAGILAKFPGASVDSAGKISITSSGFAKLTVAQKRALYNYNFVWEDGSFGVHNTSYAVQLLQRSYLGVYNRSITEDYPRIVLRGPVPERPPTGTGSWALYD